MGICFLGGCQAKQEEVVEPTPTPSTVPTVDYSDLVGKKISVTSDTQAFTNSEGSVKEVGKFFEGSLLDIDDSLNNEYLHIKDSNLYIHGSNCVDSQRWFENRTNLIATNDYIVTKDSYSIEDYKGKVICTINEPTQYTIYVHAIPEDNRYGIRFQEGIYYVKNDDVAEVKVSNEIPPESGHQVPVLMYHFFYDENNGESRVDGNYVEVNELREQCQYLKDNNYATLSMLELLYFMQERALVPTHSCAITIDDGDPTVYKYAFPVLREFKYNATLFLITGRENPQLDWEFWEMREEGLELQSHGFLTHEGGCSGMGHGGKLQCIDFDEGVKDTIMSLEYVDGGFVYCYPFGDYNQHAKDILTQAGVKMAFTTQPGILYPGMDMLELPRVRVFGGNGLNTFINSLGN